MRASPGRNSPDTFEQQKREHHQKAKRRQIELKALLRSNRLTALRSRRKCLAAVGIFTLVSIHKMEHRLIENVPVTTKEALLLLFLHNLVMHVDRVHRLITDANTSTNNGELPVLAAAPTEAPPRCLDTDSVFDVPESRPIHRSHTGVRRQGSQQSSGDEATGRHSGSSELSLKRLLRWTRSSSKAFVLALGLEGHPPAVQLSRRLDQYVDKLRESWDDHSKKNKKGPKKPPKSLNPLIFNPQPPKRFLITAGRIIEERIIQEVMDPRSKALMPPSPSCRTQTETAFGFSNFMGRHSTEVASLTDFSAAEQLDTVSKAMESELRTRHLKFLNDLVERLSHLPPALTTRLLTTYDTTEDFLSDSVSTPTQSLTPSFAPSAPSELQTPPMDEEPCSDHPWPLSESDSDHVETASPETMPPSPDIPLVLSPETMVSSVLRIFPLHILLFWEAMHAMLLSGGWDVAIEEIVRQSAKGLDFPDDIFDLLLFYTADVVAEGIELIEADPPESTLATTNSKTLRQNHGVSRSKLLKIAGVAIGVGALSALTAGIAAPAFAAGVGALGIAGTSGFATFLTTAGGSAALASLFGASSASLSGWKYSRRIADIRIFEFVCLNSNYVVDCIALYMSELMNEDGVPHDRATVIRRAMVLEIPRCLPGGDRKIQPPFKLVIGISGWLNSEEDATKPWYHLSDCLGTDVFAVKWEPHLLTALGAMMVRMVGEQFASSAASLWIQMTMAAGTGVILWPVSMLQFAGQLDNTWITCRERAQQAGVLLATVLSDQNLTGHRPVTLIGYSMGSRVISYALRELFKRGEFNRVQHAILMGLPGSKAKENWRRMRAVVTGRLVNIYCTTDWILGFLYRWIEWGLQVAGLSPVEGVPGVENFDATGIVFSHHHYEKRIPALLSCIGFHSSFVDYVARKKAASSDHVNI